jgi:hypothetical protein
VSNTKAFVVATSVAALVAVATATADLGRTALAAAKARTERAAQRESGSYGGATTYKVGSCALLHRRPWLGYRCGYTIFGRGLQCHIVLTLGVKRTPSGEYNAINVKTTAYGPVGAPC